MHYAHKKKCPDGSIQRQTMTEHLRRTADVAGACLSACGLHDTAYLAGLVHDMGKYTDAFQAYLEQEQDKLRGSVIHSFQGCRFFMEQFHKTGEFPEKITAELLSFAVGGHHGLFDCVGEGRKLGLQYREEKADTHYEQAKDAFLSDCADIGEINTLFSNAVAETNGILAEIDSRYEQDDEYCFAIGLLARLLLSAVMEGDRRDTAEFMNDASFPVWPEDMQPVWKQRLDDIETKLAQFPTDSAIAKARHRISEQCRQFAERPGGIYRLHVPTGGGKTLASLRYALAHAAQFHKKHLLFVSPLLSILEQNAKVLREFIGDDELILEHHSNVVQTRQERDALDVRELLVQSWDSPVIITTLVQFLHTLFGGKTTSVRRFHALCDSVIVIDEVQTVPAKLLTMFTLALRFASEQCGATVVLCSATQPSLDKAAHPLPELPEEIVPYDEALWKVFARTTITPVESVRQEKLPDLVRELMEQTESLLVVCNKKDEAAELLQKTKDPSWRSFHLSASMCPQHRRDTLKALYESLGKKEKTLCISTQVIEAGVDISFRSVLRLTAGMDSVVQSAGRCNRNGESAARCPVYMVNCTDEKLGRLPDIQRGKDATIALIDAYQNDPERFRHDLASFEAIDFYYRYLYRSMDEGAQDYPLDNGKTSLFDLLSLNRSYADENCAGLDKYMLRQAFRIAGDAFSVFDEDTTDIIVPYGEGKDLIEKLCSIRAERDLSYRQFLLKQAASYCVSLYRYQKKALEEKGALFSLCGDCALALREEFYDEMIGLMTENMAQTYWEV